MLLGRGVLVDAATHYFLSVDRAAGLASYQPLFYHYIVGGACLRRGIQGCILGGLIIFHCFLQRTVGRIFGCLHGLTVRLQSIGPCLSCCFKDWATQYCMNEDGTLSPVKAKDLVVGVSESDLAKTENSKTCFCQL